LTVAEEFGAERTAALIKSGMAGDLPGKMQVCVPCVHNMEIFKIGIREFRENLAGYLESDKPRAITRHGETLGFYIPAQKRSQDAELDAMRAAAKDLDEIIASRGVTEDELMNE
jgi:hypothetical protein